MPQAPQTVHVETTIKLPWLRPFDEDMESVGYAGVHANITAKPGSNAYIDVEQQKARIQSPDGWVFSWFRNGKMRYNPRENSWDMTWLERGAEEDAQASFSPMSEDCDDEIVQASGYEFEASGLENKQATYFPLFVELLRDPFFNPAGFPLKSGLYKADMTSICFELNFGEDGSKPSLQPVKDTLPAPLDFPYMTEIGVLEDVILPDGEVMPHGYYRTQVTSFNTITGAVLNLKVRHEDRSFKVSGDDMVRFMQEGKVELLNVLKEHWPNF